MDWANASVVSNDVALSPRPIGTFRYDYRSVKGVLRVACPIPARPPSPNETPSDTVQCEPLGPAPTGSVHGAEPFPDSPIDVCPSENEDLAIVFDLGQEVSGHPTFRLRGPEGWW